MVFSFWFCKFHKSGLAQPHCKLKSGQLVDYCEHKKGCECDQWRDHDGRTEEQVLERIVHGR